MMTILIILAILLIFVALYYRGNSKIKNFIHRIENILNDQSLTFEERIYDATSHCRDTKGIVSYAIYVVLDTIIKNMKYKENGTK